jgi:hypothetical protein
MSTETPEKVLESVVKESTLQRDRLAPRLAADLPGRGGRARRRREAEERARGSRQDVQGAHHGYNLLPYLTGEEEASPRKGFMYFSDDGDLVAVRFDNWKMVFMEQRMAGTLAVWAEPFTPLRVPKLFNLRTDQFERADTTSNTYWDWFINKGYMLMASQAIVAEFLATFEAFPPRQKAASFTIDQALEKMADAASGGRG